MFAILGLNLMRSKMGFCNDVSSVYGINRDMCVN